MITDKDEAILEVGKDNPNFKNIDEYLLSDKDVALMYMQHHSSNTVLVSKFPINIDVKGMIDDKEFMLSVINCLSTGYDESGLTYLLKYSANCIVKNKVKHDDEVNVEDLKQEITDILTQYNEAVKSRLAELSQKQQTMDELKKFIDDSNIIKEESKSKRSREYYRHTDIGFTAKF